MIWIIIFGIYVIVGAILFGVSIGERRAKHEHFGFWDIVGGLFIVFTIVFVYTMSLASMSLCPSDNMEYPAAEYRFQKKLLKTEVDGVVTNIDTVYFIKKNNKNK